MSDPERKAFVPGCREDVFFSYGHIDNETGWVTDLHTFLDVRIRQLLGTQDVRLWRDLKLKGADALWETVEPAIAGSALFVAVLAPRYLRSEPCRHEVECFRHAASARGGLLVDSTCRLVRVVKTPFDHSLEPAALTEIEALEFRFYRRHPLDETQFREFPSREGRPGYEDFAETAETLAQQLAGLLQRMQRRLAAPEPRPARSRVFLAETTADREADRAFLVNEIADRCELVPAEALPHTVEELEASLARHLAGCALSVHLLGSRFGLLPEGEESRSLPQIQLARAAAVRRLVWIPEELANVDPRQQQLLDAIERSPQKDLEVVRDGRQGFVQHLEDLLAELARPPAGAPVLGQAIYLVSDAQDFARPQLRELRNCILRQGFRVELPAFEGDVEELHQAEEQALRDTSAAIIYYGTARDLWVRMRRQEILKTLGTLDNGPGYCRAVYLDSPATQAKVTVYMDLPGGELPEAAGPPLLVLGDCQEPNCGKLEPLLQHLARERRP